MYRSYLNQKDSKKNKTGNEPTQEELDELKCMT
jgi:hypothetical protein